MLHLDVDVDIYQLFYFDQLTSCWHKRTLLLMPSSVLGVVSNLPTYRQPGWEPPAVTVSGPSQLPPIVPNPQGMSQVSERAPGARDGLAFEFLLMHIHYFILFTRVAVLLSLFVLIVFSRISDFNLNSFRAHSR